MWRKISGNRFVLWPRGRPGAEVVELTGVSIASLGVAFQMFNAAFLERAGGDAVGTRRPPACGEGLLRFRAGLPWAFWICEDWLAAGIRRKLSRACETYGLRLSAEMPGMAADHLRPPTRKLPDMEVRPMQPGTTLNDFRALGSTCFHVPIAWFSEVFDERVAARRGFSMLGGISRGTASGDRCECSRPRGRWEFITLRPRPSIGNTAMAKRSRVMRSTPLAGGRRAALVLQSTSQGHRLYDRMGFYPVTRVLVYNSTL